MCFSYKEDLLNGVHEPADDYKIALFSGASHDALTTQYTAANEASGTGYTAGGASLAGRTVATVDSAALAITSITRAGQVATVTTTAATHGLKVGQVVTVAGVGQTEYNVTAVITTVPALNQFTYEVEASPATPATGTITYTVREKVLDFNDPEWASSTITADSALIYNNSAVGKNAIAVLKFTSQSSLNQTFKVTLPAPTFGVALIRID